MREKNTATRLTTPLTVEMGLSKTAIAKAEGVSEKAIRIAIERGLESIEKYLKRFF